MGQFEGSLCYIEMQGFFVWKWWKFYRNVCDGAHNDFTFDRPNAIFVIEL